MIKFAICDDDLSAIERAADQLAKFGLARGDIKVEKFSLSCELKRRIESGEHFDIFMLDVVMPEVDGIDLGKIIKEKLPNSKIIYVSSSSEFAVMSYDVHAFYYLLKPLSQDKFHAVLAKALESMNVENKRDMNVKVKTVNGEHVVSMYDIKYCILDNRRIRYILQDGELVSKTIRSNFPTSIKAFLDSGMFSFCSSYLAINLSKVLRVDTNNVYFDNGEVFTLSRAHVDKFKKEYFNYYFKEVNGEND